MQNEKKEEKRSEKYNNKTKEFDPICDSKNPRKRNRDKRYDS